MSRREREWNFGWLVILILIAGTIYFFLHRQHSRKIVPAKAPMKVQSKAFTVWAQSPRDFPRPVHDVFEAQVALARRGISSGPIDGAPGSQTRMAISEIGRAHV